MAGFQTFFLFSGLLLLWGTSVFWGKKMSGWWVYGSFLGVVWIIIVVLLKGSNLLFVVPVFIFAGTAQFWTGWAFLRSGKIDGAGKIVTGLAFILWSINTGNHLYFRFLQTTIELAPWGMLSTVLLKFIIAFGILLVYFQKTRKDLSDRESYFRALIQNASDVILVIEADGTARYVSPARERVLGYGAEGVLGKSVFTYVHSDDLPGLQRTLGAAKRNPGASVTGLFRVRHADGSWRYIKMHGVSLLDNPSVGGIVINYHDITERRRMEEELREERDRAQKYLDIAGVMFVVIDVAQRVTLINKKGCEILGHSEKEVVGKNWFDNFIPERIRVSIKEDYEKCVSGQIKPVEYMESPVLVRNGGERIIAWHNTVLTDEQGKIVATLSSGEDVTEQRRAETEMNEARKKVERAGRLASLGTMAAAIAHEINQPLNAIKVTTDGTLFLHKRGKTFEAGKLVQEIADISAQADRIDNIVKRIRSFVRMEPLRELTPCHLNKVVEGALGIVGKQLSSHGIKLNKSLSNTLPPVQGEKIRLEEVVVNLLVNAMHALDKMEKPGKEICITTKFETKVILEISDNGTGIDEEIVDKIFDPFFTTKLSDKGMGLGLSIVHSIVISLQGQIKVINNDKGGATFRVEFPGVYSSF